MDLMILDFFNSSWLSKHMKEPNKDILFNKEWFRKQLELWNFRLDTELSEEQTTDLIKLRHELRKYYDQLVNHEIDIESIVMTLNQEMKKVALFKKIVKEEEYKAIFIPFNYDYDWLKYSIISSFTDLITIIDIERLRICENPDCRFVFFDNSRNSTKRHCHSGCSNLMKARRFRERSSKNK